MRKLPYYDQAKALTRMWTVVRASRWPTLFSRKAAIGESGGAFTVFLELAAWLAEQKRYGVTIPPVEWITAHLDAFGPTCQPGMLVSDTSYQRWVSYKTNKIATQTRNVPGDRDRAIALIMAGRECSRQEAGELLDAIGL